MASNDIIEECNSRTMDLGSETRASSLIDATWIRSNIKMRRCTYFVPKKEGSKICHCGYENQYHTTPLISESNSGEETKADLKWEFSKHTETEPTNAFGEIQFDGREGDIKKKFVRVDINTEMSVMLEMIQERWRMEYPNLLISVAGGSKNVWRSVNLIDGLMKVARKLGAWFITDGTHPPSIDRHPPKPAKICKEHAVIGIAPWGVIRHKEALENERGLWPARYDITGGFCHSERFLDPDHSHYILVDDGTQHKFDIEIPFRVKLEQEMAKLKTKTGNDVLIVTLFMGGGQGTLQKVDEALKQDTPVIVLKGSGGAADLLAFAFQNALTFDEYANPSRGQDSKRYEKRMTESLELTIKEKMKKSNINCSIEVIKSCLSKSDQIHIFDLDSDDNEIDAVLLNALMKAFIDACTDKRKNMIIPLDEIMSFALMYDRADIVLKLMTMVGFNLKNFLTAGKLLELYNSVLFKRIFNVIRFKKQEKIRLIDVRHLVQDLVDIDLLQRYEDVGPEKEGEKNIDDAGMSSSQEKHLLQKIHKEKNDIPGVMYPFSDLLIWSVLTNQQDIAKFMCKYGENPLSAALVAHALCSALSRQTDEQDLREAIDHNSSEFMTLAIKLTNACYEKDAEKTYDLLTVKAPQWCDATCIEIALKARSEVLISLKSFRDLFDKIWMGCLKPQNSIMMLLLCIAFPPLIIWLARFEEEDQKNSISDANKSDGQKTCCLPSKRRSVSIEDKAESSDSDEKSARCSQEKLNGNLREESKCMNPYWKLQSFYRAPIIIFMHNIISFIAFLVLYSYVLISKLEPHMSVEVVCLILWVLSFLIGEIIQFSRIQAWSAWNKWKLYIADGWNILDMLTILLFIIGMFVLMTNPRPLSVEIARVILGIDLVCFFLRILHAFHAHRQVGPKLVMIMNMVLDLGLMTTILGVFILAYAVASYAILYPNTALTIGTPMKILKRPFWNIFGELMMEEIEGEANCSDNVTLYGNGAVPRCPTKSGQYVVPVMMWIYMLMTNILLLSLLIALFSYSIEKVHKHTVLHCSHRRYNLICEFYAKPWLPHPFAILIYLPQIMVYIWRKLRQCLSSGRIYRNKLDIIGGRNVFEKINKTGYFELQWLELVQARKVYKRMEQNPEEIIDINARNTRLETKVESKFKKLEQVLKAEVDQLKQQILKYQNDMSMQLQTIMDSLKELKEHKLETKQTCNEDTDEK